MTQMINVRKGRVDITTELMYIKQIIKYTINNSMATTLIIQIKWTLQAQFAKIHKERNRQFEYACVYKEIKSIINNFPKQKAPDSDGFTREFTKYLRKNLYQFPTISFKRQKPKEYFLTQFMKPALP